MSLTHLLSLSVKEVYVCGVAMKSRYMIAYVNTHTSCKPTAANHTIRIEFFLPNSSKNTHTQNDIHEVRAYSSSYSHRNQCINQKKDLTSRERYATYIYAYKIW